MIREALLSTLLCALPAALAAQATLPGAPAPAKSPEAAVTDEAYRAEAEATYREIEAELGIVPTFVKALPLHSVRGAWSEMKSMQLSRATRIDPVTKELIGLAVASQIPCRYCSYFHESAAKVDGATDLQVREAVESAALSRHWSAFLNSPVVDQAAFRRDVDRMFRRGARTARGPAAGEEAAGAQGMREAPGARPPMTGPAGQGAATGRAPAPPATQPGAAAGFTSREEVRRDLERTYGFVPSFLRDLPDQALPGAWDQARSFVFNPDTALTQKQKALIGYGVASAMPCENCAYFSLRQAKAAGATDAELKEALGMAALTLHWSTVLNGLRLDEQKFQQETDDILRRMQQKVPTP